MRKWWFSFRHYTFPGWCRWHLRRWKCEDCGVWWKNEIVTAMTAYHYEGPPNVKGDPNRCLHLCPHCRDQYRENWSAMWDEYYSGLL